MKIALIQGNYFPWLGYFSIIDAVDLFLVYEDVQYTKNDYRNRNWLNANSLDKNQQRIWLTVPVRHESTTQKYREIKVANKLWARKHHETLKHQLKHTTNWRAIEFSIQQLFGEFEKEEYLFQINRRALEFALHHLNVRTPIAYVDEFPASSSPSRRVAEIVRSFGGTSYLSGPAAKNYISQSDFDEMDIKLEWADYRQLITNLTGYDQITERVLRNPQSALYDISNKEWSIN